MRSRWKRTPSPQRGEVNQIVDISDSTRAHDALGSTVLARVAHDVGMGGAPDVALRFRQANQLFDDPQPRAVADHVRMTGELEDPALLIGRLELAPEDVEDLRRRRVRAQALEAVHHEID